MMHDDVEPDKWNVFDHIFLQTDSLELGRVWNEFEKLQIKILVWVF